jgi:hypothetical protein
MQQVHIDMSLHISIHLPRVMRPKSLEDAWIWSQSFRPSHHRSGVIWIQNNGVCRCMT